MATIVWHGTVLINGQPQMMRVTTSHGRETWNNWRMASHFKTWTRQYGQTTFIWTFQYPKLDI